MTPPTTVSTPLGAATDDLESGSPESLILAKRIVAAKPGTPCRYSVGC